MPGPPGTRSVLRIAVALCPASYQQLGTLHEPVPYGVVTVRKYCVRYVTVRVAGAVGVTGWLTAPPSDQLTHTYWVPAEPAAGSGAVSVTATPSRSQIWPGIATG